MNKEQILKKIKEIDEELINTIRESCMYELDLAKQHLKNHGLMEILRENKENLDYEKERLKITKLNWNKLNNQCKHKKLYGKTIGKFPKDKIQRICCDCNKVIDEIEPKSSGVVI